MQQTPPSLTQALDLLGLVKAVFPRDGGLRFFTEFDFELCRGQVLPLLWGRASLS